MSNHSSSSTSITIDSLSNSNNNKKSSRNSNDLELGNIGTSSSLAKKSLAARNTNNNSEDVNSLSSLHMSCNEKSTQYDSLGWRLPGSQPQRSRPTSMSQLSLQRSNHYAEQFAYTNYAISSPGQGFWSTQSEVLLSPKARRAQQTHPQVAIDMMQILPSNPSINQSNLKACSCCCSCSAGGGQHEQIEFTRDSPGELSWRRLHMCRAKLKATTTTSELLSGFAMVAMVELQINDPTSVPEWLFIMFAVCTTVLVSVHIFALMISTYLLPNIEAVSKLQVARLVLESPHERMRGFIELAWAFSTVLGLFLFLVEIAILCWVKFWDYSFTAATASTVIVIPVLIVFIAFAVHFYHSLVVYKCEVTDSDLKELENIKRNLDHASAGHASSV